MKLNKTKIKYPWGSPPKPKEQGNDDYNIYNSTQWRKISTAHRQNNPVCVVCAAKERERPAQVTDHVVRVTDGGAWFDDRNHIGLCHGHHNRKRGKEKHAGILIKTQVNENGDLIPIDKTDIIEKLL